MIRIMLNNASCGTVNSYMLFTFNPPRLPPSPHTLWYFHIWLFWFLLLYFRGCSYSCEDAQPLTVNTARCFFWYRPSVSSGRYVIQMKRMASGSLSQHKKEKKKKKKQKKKKKKLWWWERRRRRRRRRRGTGEKNQRNCCAFLTHCCWSGESSQAAKEAIHQHSKNNTNTNNKVFETFRNFFSVLSSFFLSEMSRIW